jgi:hypothetical protein
MENSSNKVIPSQCDEHLTTGSDYFCRICLNAGPDPLIYPCFCIGTSKYVHQSCLKSWVSLKYPNLLEAHCEICKAKFGIHFIKIKKCNPKKGVSEHFHFCCTVPILVFILIALGIILFYVVFDINLNNHEAYSIIILIIIISPMIVTLLLLLKSLYKICIISEVVDWEIGN